MKKEQMTIKIEYSELLETAENIVWEEFSEYYEQVDRDSIAVILKEHIEEAIEDIMSEPLQYFKDKQRFWEDLRDHVVIEEAA